MRVIYAIEFDDNYVYIGLTNNPKKRKWDHFNDKKSQVFKHFYETKSKSKFKILTDWVEPNDASFKEGEFVEVYLKNGWFILNKIKTGGLGRIRNVNWTKEKCVEDALKYNSRFDWQKKSNGYQIAWKRGWLDECCQHMLIFKKPKNYWIKVKCVEDALRFQTKKDWKKYSNGGYDSAKRNGWLKECCSHMKRPISVRLKWTLELCKNEAKKYQTRMEWKLNSNRSYQAAKDKGWLNECCTHMKYSKGWEKRSK